MSISWRKWLLILLLVSGLAVLALFKPFMFLRVETLGLLLAVGFVAYMFPSVFLGIAIAFLALSPGRLIGEEIFGVGTGNLHRLVILLVLGINVVRFSIRPHINAPLVALVVIFFSTLAFADMHPNLTQYQMWKSLLGLMFPFFFISANYNPKAIPRLLLVIALMPALSVLCGSVLDLGGLRDGMTGGVDRSIDTGVSRLRGMNPVAYLAFFGYIAFFVSLFEAIVSKKKYFYALAVINLIIVLLTIARTPSVLVLFLGTFAVIFTSQHKITYSTKTGIFIVGVTLVSAFVILFWTQLETRMFGAVGGVVVNLSQRDLVWSIYLDAIDVNVWFGRGIGAGTVVLIHDSRIGTIAAHNEYIRLLVDAGIFGLVVFIVSFVLWIRSDLRWMDRDEQVLMMSFVVALALFSLTDNTLSAPPTLVMFFAMALLFARVRYTKLAHGHVQGGC